MAAAAFDAYGVLGVARTATEAEIRVAYRDLVARYHPDKHAGNPLEGLAADKMAEINRAYEILSDRQKRAAYDRGQSGYGPGPASSGPVAVKNRLMKTLGFLLLLPLLIRFGRGLVRLLVAIVRIGWESLQGVRGTPVGLALVSILVVFFVALLVRRRRAKARRS
jgi:curved DNA-binding protein CbpA